MSDFVSRIATEVLGCLCDTLQQEGRPVCRCALYHGASHPPADDCACECGSGQGQAWVRVAGVQAAHRSQGQRLEVCQTNEWRIQLELGTYRCVSVLDESGEPPSGSEQTADALAAYEDAATLRRVVLCCPALEDVLMRIDGWDPLGPLGGCAGGVLRTVVQP